MHARKNRVEAQLATELSGFLATDMSDTLVVAVSQSGTTTGNELLTLFASEVAT